MIKNIIIFIIWHTIGIIISQIILSKSNQKTYALFATLQIVIFILIFEHGSKYVQLGYFSSNNLLLTTLIQNYLISINFI